jgi:hypothetical protein
MRIVTAGAMPVDGSGTPEVLFAVRMHPRKRPLAFVEMAKALLDAGVDARFTLVGPDEREDAALRAALKGDSRISQEGALAPAAIPRRMAAASVFVLPSVREPYPMSVLEAMSVGLPVVVTDDWAAPLVDRTHCGVVTDPEARALAAAVESILADRSLARAMGERSRETVRTELGMRRHRRSPCGRVHRACRRPPLNRVIGARNTLRCPYRRRVGQRARGRVGNRVDREAPQASPMSIAVIGDSYTAGIQNRVV